MCVLGRACMCVCVCVVRRKRNDTREEKNFRNVDVDVEFQACVRCASAVFGGAAYKLNYEKFNVGNTGTVVRNTPHRNARLL